ncbi:MAG: GMC family oxidoreductase [Gemmatimonadales bacterium]
MIIDTTSATLDPVVNCDVCIVGAGAAGITIARELIGGHLTVALFESGGLMPDRRTQALNRGSYNNPYDHALEDSQSRSFGGTTNLWSGWCRPLDESDFTRRDWIPHSGWPLSIETLQPWYNKARRVCELDDENPATLADRGPWPFDQRRLSTRRFDLSPPTRFGQKFRAELASSPNVRVCLNANAVAFGTDESTRRIESIEFKTLSGKSILATARVFILAAGGIENPRLLLSSGATRRCALGNENDLVGRFYMNHLAFFSAEFRESDTCPSVAFYTTPFDGRPATAGRHSGAASHPESVMRERKLLGAVLRFVHRPSYAAEPAFYSSAVASARIMATSLLNARVPGRALMHASRSMKGGVRVTRFAVRVLAHSVKPKSKLLVRCIAESAPDPDNRVTLSSRPDALGQPTANVRWEIGEAERKSVRVLHTAFATEISRLGFGKVSPIHPDFLPNSLTGASHHIGTTRMHDSPRHGVVDRDCRVHDIANLFISGSSVFATSGYANPTLTIIALSLRLAERIKSILR